MPKVLLVYAEQEWINVLTEFLHKSGFETASARTVEEAIGLYQEYQPDILVSEIVIPYSVEKLQTLERLENQTLVVHSRIVDAERKAIFEGLNEDERFEQNINGKRLDQAFMAQCLLYDYNGGKKLVNGICSSLGVEKFPSPIIFFTTQPFGYGAGWSENKEMVKLLPEGKWSWIDITLVRPDIFAVLINLALAGKISAPR